MSGVRGLHEGFHCTCSSKSMDACQYRGMINRKGRVARARLAIIIDIVDFMNSSCISSNHQEFSMMVKDLSATSRIPA